MAASLTFMTSLAHPDYYLDFSAMCYRLTNTLRSVLRQTVDNIDVLVVCQSEPDIDVDDPRVRYLEVDFPPVVRNPPSADVSEWPGRLDKGCKYMAGLLALQDEPPAYVMFFDADDFVSRHLAELVQDSSQTAGWYIDTGLIYRSGNDLLLGLSNFHLFCGTCNILRFDQFQLFGLKAGADYQEIITGCRDRYLRYILGSHRYTANYQHERGRPLAPVSFPGAVYHIGHGGNATEGQRFDHQNLPKNPLNEAIRNEFGL